MKFKVSPKDLIIFSVFSIFLLYFSAIAVLNVLSLINDGVFYGLNPVEAFSGKYILATLFVFFAVLIAIFFSVSSSIFERTKGLGLSFGEKEEKGYSRWLKEKEMKKAYKIFKVGVKDVTASAGGVAFINDGKNMWVDDSENHTLVIGVTGAGKTTAVVDPLIYSLCKHGESMVITDPKGEIYKNHAELLKGRGYNIVVLNFRQPTMGNAWNPLTLPYQLYKAGNVDKAVELVDDVALNILQDKKASDPFWGNSASDYFSGCALGLLEDAEEAQVNLNSISYMTTVGEEKFGAGSTYIKEYFTLKGEQSSAYIFASNTINSPTETKGGILSVFRQKIRLFASREQLSEMLAYSDFNMRDIGKEKTAVFMVIHDEKTTYHALATIFIKQCYETLIDVAQENGGKLPFRTNFILDEFANMPPLKDVTTMVTAARSRAIRFTFIIQNFAQLNEVYGKEDAETIRSNCGNLLYLLTTELSALEEISKLCGEVKSKKDDKTASQPLVTVSDLQKLKMNEVIILRNRLNPFRTKLKQGFDTDWGDSEFGKAEFTERPKKEIQLFDVLEHVKLRKKSKMMDSLDPKKVPSMPSGMPDFSSMLGGAGMPGMNSGMPSKIPTFEEFMAARNNAKKDKKEASKPTMPTFDVDDLVKRIDAKIAELEAQEKAEEEAKKNSDANAEMPIPKEQETFKMPELPKFGADSMEELSRIEKPIIDQEVLRDTSGVSFNPFNEMREKTSETTPFIEKDVIQNATEEIKTGPITAPVIEPQEKQKEEMPKVEGEIRTFEDLMSQPSSKIEKIDQEIPSEAKPEMPNEPENISEIPMPSLSGIIDPLKSVPMESFENNVRDEVPSTKQEELVQTKENQENATSPNINVDTSSKVIQNISDDAFFDDFFDED